MKSALLESWKGGFFGQVGCVSASLAHGILSLVSWLVQGNRSTATAKRVTKSMLQVQKSIFDWIAKPSKSLVHNSVIFQIEVYKIFLMVNHGVIRLDLGGNFPVNMSIRTSTRLSSWRYDRLGSLYGLLPTSTVVSRANLFLSVKRLARDIRATESRDTRSM